MNSVDLKRAKRAARARVLAVRDGASPEQRAEWSRVIADRFLELE
jgi:hypothetical protein